MTRVQRGSQRAWYDISWDAWRVIDLAARVQWWVPCGSICSDAAIFQCGPGWQPVSHQVPHVEFMRA